MREVEALYLIISLLTLLACLGADSYVAEDLLAMRHFVLSARQVVRASNGDDWALGLQHDDEGVDVWYLQAPATLAAAVRKHSTS